LIHTTSYNCASIQSVTLLVGESSDVAVTLAAYVVASPPAGPAIGGVKRECFEAKEAVERLVVAKSLLVGRLLVRVVTAHAAAIEIAKARGHP
jgi:hypothetical protein